MNKSEFREKHSELIEYNQCAKAKRHRRRSRRPRWRQYLIYRFLLFYRMDGDDVVVYIICMDECRSGPFQNEFPISVLWSRPIMMPVSSSGMRTFGTSGSFLCIRISRRFSLCLPYCRSDTDSYCLLAKQNLMLRFILGSYDRACRALDEGVTIEQSADGRTFTLSAAGGGGTVVTVGEDGKATGIERVTRDLF